MTVRFEVLDGTTSLGVLGTTYKTFMDDVGRLVVDVPEYVYSHLVHLAHRLRPIGATPAVTALQTSHALDVAQLHRDYALSEVRKSVGAVVAQMQASEADLQAKTDADAAAKQAEADKIAAEQADMDEAKKKAASQVGKTGVAKVPEKDKLAKGADSGNG